MKEKKEPMLINFPVPIITPQLILRPPQVGDGIAVNEAVLESFEVLNKSMSWADHKPSINESEIYVRRGAANWILKKNEEPYLPLFVFDKKTNRYIGDIVFHRYNWEISSLRLGYWVRNQFTGQGLMTEGINAVTQYAINQLGIRRIEIRCDINNIRSKKIPERLGYYLEAVLNSNRVDPTTGEISDTLLFVRHNLKDLPSLSATWKTEDFN